VVAAASRATDVGASAGPGRWVSSPPVPAWRGGRVKTSVAKRGPGRRPDHAIGRELLAALERTAFSVSDRLPSELE
jgi:hypothetical protein